MEVKKKKRSEEQISKYRELLRGIQDKEKKLQEDKDMEMEITWVPGTTTPFCLSAAPSITLQILHVLCTHDKYFGDVIIQSSQLIRPAGFCGYQKPHRLLESARVCLFF